MHFFDLDNKLYKMNGTYIKIVEAQQQRAHKIYFSILLLLTPLLQPIICITVDHDTFFLH
jgi:hypothetical protein